MVHIVKGFDVVNKAKADVCLELSCFFDDPADIGNLISCASAFSKSSLSIWKLTVPILLKPGVENFEHYFVSMWNECNCVVAWTFYGIAFLWERNGVAIIFNKRVQNAVLGCNLKNDRIISCLFPRQTIFTVIQVYAPTTNAEEAEVKWFCDDLQDLLELTARKDVLFHHRGLECKSRSQGIPEVTQIWPWSIKWSRAKANRVLPREHIGHSKHPLPKTQETTLYMDITRWSIVKSDW